MLSSPDAKGSKGEHSSLGRQSIGCEAQHDLVFARAREPIAGATSERRYQGQSNQRAFTRRTRILKPLTSPAHQPWPSPSREGCRVRTVSDLRPRLASTSKTSTLN